MQPSRLSASSAAHWLVLKFITRKAIVQSLAIVSGSIANTVAPQLQQMRSSMVYSTLIRDSVTVRAALLATSLLHKFQAHSSTQCTLIN